MNTESMLPVPGEWRTRASAACRSLGLALVLALSTAAQVRSDEEKPAVPKPEGGTDKAAPAGAGESAARAKAEKIIVPGFELKDATVNEALDFLRKKAVESDPEKKGVNIVVKPGTITPTVADTRITVWLKTIPVIEALGYITGLANLEFAVTPDALVVQPISGGGGGAPASPIPRIPGLDPAPGNAGAEPKK